MEIIKKGNFTKNPVVIKRRKKARKGCLKCPNCGEKWTDSWEYIPGCGACTTNMIDITYLNPWKDKDGHEYTTDVFTCENCGAVWYGEAYQIDI